mgnify:CR=1 FL=1
MMPVSVFPLDRRFVIFTLRAIVRLAVTGVFGCPVQAFLTGFSCPCHGGQYDTEGRRIGGPPVRPLNRYETTVNDKGHLILGQLYAMDDSLHRHQLKGPGQPVKGLLSYLYPDAPQG